MRGLSPDLDFLLRLSNCGFEGTLNCFVCEIKNNILRVQINLAFDISIYLTAYQRINIFNITISRRRRRILSRIGKE